MDAHLVELTAVESELLTKEFLQLQFHEARVPYALGGLAGLAAGAETWLRDGYDVEPVASFLRTVRVPTKWAPVIVHVRSQEVHDAEGTIIYDRRRHSPFDTYRCRWNSPRVQGQRGVECFVKIVPMMPGAEPGRAGERNWRTWAYIVLDQLTLAVGEAAGSDGHFAALMVARWAFLFGTALYRLENERFPPPAGQHADDLVDHSIRYTLDVAMAQLLVGAHGVRMIDQWLDMLTPASVVGGADWEIAHFGEQYHVLAPVTQQGQRNELVGQYSEIFKGLRAALYAVRDRLDPHGQHYASLAKSAYEPQSRSRRAERRFLL